MTTRRTFIGWLGAAGCIAPGLVGAQAPEVVKRFGVLVDGPESPAAPPPQVIDAMRERGWVQGRNLAFVIVHGDTPDRLRIAARELVEARVDVILAFSTRSALAAKAATTTIPIVFTVGDDPVATGLVASLSRPGGNLTGSVTRLLDDKLLDILKKAIPTASRVAFPVAVPSDAAMRAGRALNVEIIPVPLGSAALFDAFLLALQKARPDAVVIPNVAWMNPMADRFARSFRGMRMPAISWTSEFARAGGLLAYAAVTDENFVKRRAAMVDELLRGANPGEMAVEMPIHYRLTINLATAEAFRITIPRSLLMQALPEDIIRS